MILSLIGRDLLSANLLCPVDEELKLPVSSENYLSKLVEYGIMKIHAAAVVKETNQSWIEEDDFQVIMPNVDIKVKEPIT